MAKGICSVCNIPVGGFRQTPGYICPGCQRIYCEKCISTNKRGFFQKSFCPNCGRQVFR